MAKQPGPGEWPKPVPRDDGTYRSKFASGMLNDDGVDPQGGKTYSRYQRTRVEKIYTEYLGKVKHEAELNPSKRIFQMNLANKTDSGELLKLKHSHNRLEIIADKPEQSTPQIRGSAKGMDRDSYEVGMIRHLDKGPTDKFDIPMTRAQEIGWLISNPVRARTIRDIAMRREYPKPTGTEEPEPKAAESSSPVAADGKKVRKSKSTSSLQELTKSWPHVPAGPPHPQCALMNKRPSQWHHPKDFCPITKYADTYVAVMHHNPFNGAAARGGGIPFNPDKPAWKN